MAGVLRGVVADLDPAGLFRSEFVEAVPEPGLGIQRIGSDGKARLLRQDLAQRTAADPAEAAGVFVGRLGLIGRHMLPALHPAQILALDEDDGAGPRLAAARAMAGAHGRGLSQKLEPNRTATAASLNHDRFP